MKKRIMNIILALLLVFAAFPGFRVQVEAVSESYLWPVEGIYTMSRGYYSGHQGIDITASNIAGQNVLATKSGTIIASANNCPHLSTGNNRCDCNGGCGNYVKIKHNDGTYSRYLHLKQGSARAKGAVSQGEVIGQVWSSGDSSGYHLHFEIYNTSDQRINANPTDARHTYWGSHDPGSISYIYEVKADNGIDAGEIVADTFPSHCTVMVTAKNTYIKSLPCSEKTDPNSANVEIAQKNTAYEAIGLCLNTAGNLWYKVKAKNGETGYMYAGDTEFVELLTDDVTVNGVAAPTELKEGSVFSIKGTIESRCQTITKVSAWVENSESEEKTGDSALVITQYYDLHNSEVDMGVRFNDLPADKNAYTYYIGVTVESCYAESATVVGVKQKRVILHKSDFYVRGDAVCDHAYSGNVTAEVGCTTGGTKTFTCVKCGHSYTEAIAPLGHSFTDYRDDNNATCTAEGTKTAKCDRCSATDTVKAGYTLGHHCRHEVTIKPTESTAGILTTTCTGCGAEWTDSLPKLSNEEYSYQVIVEPDAYNEGIGRYTWKNTDHGEVAFQVAIPKLENEPAKAGIIAENVTAKAGETVCIAVRITNNPGIAYAKLKIDYDSGLQLVSAEDQGVLKGTYTTSNSVSTKPYVVQWMGAEDSKANGCIMILTFRVPENAAAGDYGISISCEEAYNEEFADVSVAAATGVLRISKSTPGDSNGDGKVNGKDGVLLAQYLAEWDVAVDLNAADVNGDGKVNGKDGVLMAQYLAEWDVTLK